MRRTFLVTLAALGLSAVPALVFSAGAAVDPSLLAGMKARSIGPAAMSGRIAAIESSARNGEAVTIEEVVSSTAAAPVG